MWSAVSDRTVTDLILRTCRVDPAGAAIIFEDGVTLTRGGFLERVEQFAGYVREKIQPGDRVAIMVGNRAEYMIAWAAVLASRGILVSINPEAKEHDAAHILLDSRPVLAIAGIEQRPVLEAIRGGIPELADLVWVGDGEPDGLAAYTEGVTPLPLAEAGSKRMDITNVYYTSGTTGLPKGCMIDHEYWIRLVDIDLRLHPKTREDRILCCLQFYYLD